MALSSSSIQSAKLRTDAEDEELLRKGARKKPTRGQSMLDFYRSITHLHLNDMGLQIAPAALKHVAATIQVLYLYDNKITTLAGLAGTLPFRSITHFYAQNNELEDLAGFITPPSLQQLHLSGNRLRFISGMTVAQQLKLLDVAGQRGNSSTGGLDEPLQFEVDSLATLSQTLETLDASGCAIDDDAAEPLVLLQSLTTLKLANNNLTSIERLQQLLSRLPRLRKLVLAGNPLVRTPKWRERCIVACATLEEIDSKEVKPNERAFLHNLTSRPAANRVAEGAASRSKPALAVSRVHGPPVSISSARSQEISFPGIGGTAPATLTIDNAKPASSGAHGLATAHAQAPESCLRASTNHSPQAIYKQQSPARPRPVGQGPGSNLFFGF